MVFLLLCFGTFEYGRAFFLQNHIAHAADVAARKLLLDPAVTDAELEDAFRTALTQADASLLEIAIASEVSNGVNVRKMVGDYPHMLLVPGLAGVTLSVARHIPVP